MPLIRFAGKKIFKDSIRSQTDFEELEQTYYLGDEPIVMPLAVRIDRLENKDLLINKIHKTGPSLGNPALLDITGRCKLRFEGQMEEEVQVFHNVTDLRLVGAGLGNGGGLALAPWYLTDVVDPDSIEPLILHTATEVPLVNVIPPASEAEALVITGAINPEPLHAEHTVNDSDISATPDAEGDLDRRREPITEQAVVACSEVESEPTETHPDQIVEDIQQEDLDLLSILDREEELTSESPTSDEEVSESLFGSMPISFQHFSSTDAQGSGQTDSPTPIGRGDVSADPVIDLSDHLVDSSAALESTSDQLADNETLSSLEDILNRSEVLTSGAPEEVESTLPAWDAVDDAVADELEAVADEPSELDAWMDEEELEEVLKESPDAYSDETEGDNPTAIQASQETPARGTVVKAPVYIAETDDLPSAQAKPKKGGLASFVRSRQQK